MPPVGFVSFFLGDSPLVREAKRKLVAQLEISHEAAEAILKSQAARTDEKFPGIIHVSHQLALLHGHEHVFFCTQCGAVNAGGSLRLLKSLCDGSGESTNMSWQMRSAHFERALFFLNFSGCYDSPCIVSITSHQKLFLSLGSSACFRLMGRPCAGLSNHRARAGRAHTHARTHTVRWSFWVRALIARRMRDLL